MIIGLILIPAGWLYDLMFAGIPFQDPTAHMLESYVFHQRVASTISGFGAALLLLSLLFAASRRVCQAFTGERKQPPL